MSTTKASQLEESTDSTAMHKLLADWTFLFRNSGAFGEYLLDVAQRNILFCDLLRQRSSQYAAHKADPLPHVLRFDAELVLDARTFDRPANYLLAYIVPPAGVVIDPKKRPFVVVQLPRKFQNNKKPAEPLAIRVSG